MSEAETEQCCKLRIYDQYEKTVPEIKEITMEADKADSNTEVVLQCTKMVVFINLPLKIMYWKFSKRVAINYTPT